MGGRLRFLTFISGIGAVAVWMAVVFLLTKSTPPIMTAPTPMMLPSTQDDLFTTASDEGSVSSIENSIQSDFLRPSPDEPILGQTVIRFAANTTQQQRAEYLASIGGKVNGTIDALDTVIVILPQKVTVLPPSSIVIASEPDYYVRALYSLPTSDTYYADQWALTVIGAPEAWSIAADAPKLTIAVIDSGVFAEHTDLAGRVLAGWDFVQDDAIPQDEFGHGTAISGIIAANIDNQIGIAGIAPNVDILPLRVLNAQGIGTYSDVAAAMIYATDNGAEIINLSLGGVNASSLLQSAVSYATSRGVIVIAAAGNSGVEGALYPAAYPEVIAVGAVDSTLQRSSFSNYGPQVDIYAPGRDILTTGKDGNYVRVTGTSFAAPHVAGVAALELARGKNLVLDEGVLHLVAPQSDPTPLPTIDVPVSNQPDNIVSAQAVTCIFTQITDTTGEGNDGSSVSGDGLSIAFTSKMDPFGANLDGETELFLWDVDAATLFQITDFPSDPGAIIPYLNYDGSRMAVVVAQDLTSGNPDLSYEIFLWEAGTFTQLTDITESSPLGPEPKLAMNDAGNRIAFLWSRDAAGNNADNSEELFLWEEGVGVSQITNSSGSAPFGYPPSMSDDGQIIAFNFDRDLTGRNPDENSEIFVYDALNLVLKQMTHTTGSVSNTMPTVNGDGSRIAFVSNANLVGTNADGNSEIFLYQDFRGFSQITFTTGGSSENFSPNLNSFGSRIVFSFGHNLAGLSGASPYELYLWDEVEDFTKVTNETSPFVIPHSISDTGKFIVFQSDADYALNNVDGNIEVFLAECAIPLTITRQPTNQTINSGGTASLQVTATGDSALTYQWYQGVSGDTSNPIMGEVNTTFETPALSTNTQYWVQVSDGLTTVNSDTATVTVLPASALSCSLTQITDAPGFSSYGASISGDGTRMAFVSNANLVGNNADNSQEIFRWDEDDGFLEVTTIVTPGQSANSPSINGDGTRVAFVSDFDYFGTNSDNNPEIFLWDESNGYTQITTTTGASNSAPSLSLDGTRIAFMSSANLTGGNADGSVEVFLWEAPGTLTQVTDSTSWLFSGALSRNGTRIILEGYADFANNNSDLNRELFVWNSTTLDFTQITDTIGDNSNNFLSPEISGEGTRVGFWAQNDFTMDNTDLNLEAFYWDEITGFSQVTKTSVQGAYSGVMNFDGTRMMIWSPSNFTGDNTGHNFEWFLWDETLGFTQIINTLGTDFTLNVESMDNAGNRIGITTNDNIGGGSEIYLADCTGEPPTITTQPQDQVIAGGTNATLTVEATGLGTLSYQWYEGISGDTSNPIFGAESDTFVTDPLVSTTQFWVRVSNPFGSTDSVTATVTVTTAFCATVTGLTPAECEALEAFYGNTNGASWTVSTGWMTDTTPCGDVDGTWFGLTCTGDHATSLSLPANNLTNMLPSALDNLDFLQTLVLSDNELSSVIPPELGSMAALQWLDLSNNDFTGGIPAALGNSTSLQTLILADIPTLGGSIPTQLGNILTVQTLVLHNAGLTGTIPSQLGNLSNLINLYLTDNQLTGTIPTQLGTLANLQQLGLSDNQLTGSIPTSFSGLTDLEILGLHNNKLSGAIPTELGSLTNLETLLLHNNAFIGQVPSAITALTALGTQNNVPNNTWSFDDEVNFGYNAIYASVPTATFLTSKDADWANTQTIAPSNVAIGTVTTDSVELTWTAIPYIADGGHYEVEFAMALAGPYSVHGMTTDKTATGYTVTGLTSNTTYYFRVRTFTPLHEEQQNDLYSEYSPVVSTTTQFRFCDTVTDIPDTECQALEALFNSTDGSSWTNNTGWMLDSTVCGGAGGAWYGLTCSGGHVTELDLNNNQLDGSIPALIGNLTFLERLNLSTNSFGGTSLPTQIGSLTNLTELVISSAALGGTIPSEISNLTNLEILNLSGNASGGLGGTIPSQLGSLVNLQTLDLSFNQFSGNIPPALGNLANVQIFWLEANNLTGSIPPEIGDLSSVTFLRLGQNPLTGALPPELGNLSNVVHFWIYSTQISGSIPTQLGNLTNAQTIMLNDNQLNGNIPVEFGSLSTNLIGLALNNNQLTGAIPIELGNMLRLEQLWLHNNQLSGNLPVQLGSLTNLRELILYNNQLTGVIPTQFSSLTNLRVVLLQNNRLSGSLPSNIGNWTNLQTLLLQNNQFSGDVPTTIVNLTQLGTVDNLPNYGWTNNEEVDFGYNALFASNQSVRDFLFSKDADWAYTQTVAPNMLTVSGVTIDSVTLAWVPILYTDDGGHYEVEFAASVAGPFTLHGTTTDKTASGYVVTGLTDNTQYYFRVRTFTPLHDDQQSNLYSNYSSIVTATPQAPPATPTSLTAGPATMNTMPLTWVDNADDETYYNLERSPSGANNWSQIALLPANTVNYLDAGLACNTLYDYRVRAYRSGDSKYSDYSNVASASTLACPPPQPQTAGLYKDGMWNFRDTNTTGLPDVRFRFGPQEAGWTPLVGDWDGDGVDGIGVYKDSVWLLRNSADSGTRDIAFIFNPLGAGAVPIVGDWNSDGIDTIGLYKNGMFVLRNSNSVGTRDLAFSFNPGSGWLPVAGDWNGDNYDTVGFYKDGRWLLTNTLQGSPSTFNFAYGPTQTGWLPITGDWDALNGDSIGLYKDGVWRLRNTNNTGGADIGFSFILGATGWKPVPGYRGGVGGLMALGLSEEPTAPILPILVTPTQEATPTPDVTTTPSETTVAPSEAPSETETPLAPTESPTESAPIVTESPPPTATEVSPSESPVPETTQDP